MQQPLKGAGLEEKDPVHQTTKAGTCQVLFHTKMVSAKMRRFQRGALTATGRIILRSKLCHFHFLILYIASTYRILTTNKKWKKYGGKKRETTYTKRLFSICYCPECQFLKGNMLGTSLNLEGIGIEQ